MTPQDTDNSWEILVSRANAESPLLAIDVRHAVRSRLEAETARPMRSPGTLAVILDELGNLARGLRGLPLAGAASVAILLLVWKTAPAVREVVLAIDLQRQLLADF